MIYIISPRVAGLQPDVSSMVAVESCPAEWHQRQPLERVLDVAILGLGMDKVDLYGPDVVSSFLFDPVALDIHQRYTYPV